MKTMKQAIVFPAALAVIAALALLAAGCAMPSLDGPEKPAEAGVLRVSLGGDPARTLLPEIYEVTSLLYPDLYRCGRPRPG
jgi:hypothetical protein